MGIQLQLLLKREARNAAGIAQARDAAQALGMNVTGSGFASLSADVTPDVFESLFGSAPGDDAGALQVPGPLAGLVESITRPLPHTYLQE